MLEPITLQTVRPFVMEDIDLDEAIEAAQITIEEKQGVIKVLKKKIHELIARADREWKDKYKHLAEADRPRKMLPLIRLRVAHTRHDIGNIVRFGQEFVDKVANPRDLLQFHKKKAAQASKKNANLKENYLEPTEEMLPAERLEKVHMSDLVQTYLSTQQLQILNPAGLERAVMNFVDKDDRDAISHFIDKEMKTTNTGLVAINPDEAKLQIELERIREEKMRLEDGDLEEEQQQEKTGKSTAKDAKAKSHRSQIDSDDSMLDDLDDDGFEQDIRTNSVTRNGRATPSQRTSATPKNTQSTLMFRGNSDDDDEEDLESPPPKKATSSRAAALSASTTRKKKVPAPKKATTSGRAAAKKASSKFVESQADEESIILSSDDDFEVPSKSKSKTVSRGRR